MTTVIAIGDQHFKTDNIQEVDLFIKKTTELVKEKEPDFIVLLGDMLDTFERVHTTPLNRAYEFINNMRKITKTFVLAGNHDMENHLKFLSNDHWLNALKEWDNVTVVDRVVSYVVNDHKFVFTPYVYVGRFEEALNTLEDGWIDAKCIFAHQEFFGCKMGAFNSIDGDKWDLSYPDVISGHIHLNQKPQANIYYPGSSLSVAFGETVKNIIAYLNFSDEKEFGLEEITLDLPKKKIIYVDSQDADNIEIPKTEDKIKLSISGEYEDFKSFKKTKKYKELTQSGVKVVFKAKRAAVKEQKESIKQSLDNNPNDFNEIIRNIVKSHKDSYLNEAYELVVNSKEIKSEDMFFI